MRQLFLLAIAAVAMSGCFGSVDPADIAVASYPAAFAAEALAGDDLTVIDLSSSAALHDFEPSARDIAQLRQTSHLVLWDEGLESWAHDATGALGSNAPQVLEIVRLPPGEDFLDLEGEEAGHDHDHGHDHGTLDHDPHTWNDPRAMRASVAYLGERLAAEYPDHAEQIQARADALTARLDDLDAAFTNALAHCSRDTIVTNHEAHNYLARRYGFDVFALHGLAPGSEPSPGTVDEAIRIIKDLGLPTIFIEEGTDPSALEAIKDETGVAIRVLHTNEARPASGDYITTQEANLAQLRFTLGCQ